MLDIIYEWIKNLAFYLVIMTAALEVLPGTAYKKYIQFFTGLVLILLVMTPVLKLTGAFGEFQARYRSQEMQIQEEIERQREVLESADVFDFLPEEYEGTEEKQDKTDIKVEEIKIGENQEQDMELDTFGE